MPRKIKNAFALDEKRKELNNIYFEGIVGNEAYT
jgi:hypothetical protein